MASADQTFDVFLVRPTRGHELLRLGIGKRLTGLRRYVLGLGTSSDERGHGITELAFGKLLLLVRPGPNEDYIVVEEGPPKNLASGYWTLVDAEQVPDWSGYLGARLQAVDFYTDGREDVALLFHLEEGKSFSVVLHDTDLLMADALEPFDDAVEEVTLRVRECLRAG